MERIKEYGGIPHIGSGSQTIFEEKYMLNFGQVKLSKGQRNPIGKGYKEGLSGRKFNTFGVEAQYKNIT